MVQPAGAGAGSDHRIRALALGVQTHLESWQPLLSAARLGALAAFALGGFLWLHLRYRARRIGMHVLKRRLVRHWRLVAWLVLIEALLGQQLLRHFIAAVTGTGP